MRETIQNANGKQFHAVSLSGGKDSTSITIHMVKLIPNNIFFSILRPRPFAETAAYFNNTTFGAGQKTIHPAPKVKR